MKSKMKMLSSLMFLCAVGVLAPKARAEFFQCYGGWSSSVENSSGALKSQILASIDRDIASFQRRLDRVRSNPAIKSDPSKAHLLGRISYHLFAIRNLRGI